MTQYELAEVVGVDPKYISRIETGTSYPSLSIVEKIFTALNIDIGNISQNDVYLNKEDMIVQISNNLRSTSENNVRIIKEIVDLITANY